MPKHGLELTQNELDDLARLLCAQSMSVRDKESFAWSFVKQYKVTREYRFVRYATIPNYEEALNEDGRKDYHEEPAEISLRAQGT